MSSGKSRTTLEGCNAHKSKDDIVTTYAITLPAAEETKEMTDNKVENKTNLEPQTKQHPIPQQKTRGQSKAGVSDRREQDRIYKVPVRWLRRQSSLTWRHRSVLWKKAEDQS